MIVGGLDIETTGLNCEKGDRIIEVCLIALDTDTGMELDCYTQRIHPEGKSIDPKAEEVHKISAADHVGMPAFRDVVDDLLVKLGGVEMLIIHNMDFDGPFLLTEIMTAGREFPAHLKGFCTMENGRWACADGKSPRLGELAYALGVDYDPSKAHAAEYDVRVMLECFKRGLATGFFNLENAT